MSESTGQSRAFRAILRRLAGARRVVLLTSLLFGLACLVAAGTLGWEYSLERARATVAATGRLQIDTERSARRIDDILKRAPAVADRIAAEAARLQPGSGSIDDLLRMAMAGNQSLAGAGAAFEPFALTPSRRLFARAARRGEGNILPLDQRLDYTRFEHRWYGDALLDGPVWTVPVVAPGGDAVVAIYSRPFTRDPAAAGDAPRGVAYVAVDLADVTAVLDSLDLGTRGYAYAFSQDGAIISHPQRDLVRAGRTVFESAWESGDTALNSAAIDAVRGGHGLQALVDPITGQASWLAYQPVPDAGWTVAVIYFQDAFNPNADLARRGWFRMVALAAFGVGLLGWTVTMLLIDRRPVWLWINSWTMTAALLAGMVGLWAIERRFPPYDDYQQVVVYSDAETEQYLRTVARGEGDVRAPVDRLPVGIFVTSIEFKSSIDVDVTGYLWHEQPVGSAAPRVVLADAPTADFREIVRRPTTPGRELTVWQFSATLREFFSYERFPFDEQQVWVRIRGTDPTTRFVPVPNFKSYTGSNPVTRPGVASDLVLPDWDLTGSYFDFRIPKYSVNFGDDRFDGALPELYFNITLQRRFLSPFVSYMLPLGVAAAMLFALLLISTKHEERSVFTGFTAKDIVQGVAALFFVVSFQHIALRTSLASAKLIYLEYFYFVSYFTLLAVAADGILFAGRSGIALIEFRDNLLPKLSFWPTVMALLFVVTFLRFY